MSSYGQHKQPLHNRHICGRALLFTKTSCKIEHNQITILQLIGKCTVKPAQQGHTLNQQSVCASIKGQNLCPLQYKIPFKVSTYTQRWSDTISCYNPRAMLLFIMLPKQTTQTVNPILAYSNLMYPNRGHYISHHIETHTHIHAHRIVNEQNDIIIKNIITKVFAKTKHFNKKTSAMEDHGYPVMASFNTAYTISKILK